jgi:hypothetical protein
VSQIVAEMAIDRVNKYIVPDIDVSRNSIQVFFKEIQLTYRTGTAKIFKGD